MNLNDFNMMLALIEEAKGNPQRKKKQKRMANWKRECRRTKIISGVLALLAVFALLYLYYSIRKR